MKKEYANDRHSSEKTYLAGSEWYKLEAYRAVNQAIGRVIRHKTDYGAIIFLDKRFAEASMQSNLSDWVKKSIVDSQSNYEKSMRKISCFFKTNLVRKDNNGCADSKFASKSSFTFKRPLDIPTKKVEQVVPVAAKKPKKIVIKNSAASMILNYKANDTVLQLKSELTKEDLITLKTSIKKYRDGKDIDLLCKDLLELVQQSKISKGKVSLLHDFIKDSDHNAKYKTFLRSLQ